MLHTFQTSAGSGRLSILNSHDLLADDKGEIAAVRQSQPYYCRALPYLAVAAAQGPLENVVDKWRV